MKINAVVHEKIHATGHNTELYNALWHQGAVYPPVMPGTIHVLLMYTFGGEIKAMWTVP